MGPVDLTEARQEELKYIDKISMCEEAPLESSCAETGEPPIGARWADVVKTSDGETFIRGRLLARDFPEKFCQDGRLVCCDPDIGHP